MRGLVAALGAAAIAGTALGGCSFNVGVNSTPILSKEKLQEDISERLARAGAEPRSVTCKGDLAGEVGATTRCDVVLSETNSFEPIVKVTGVEGATIRYDVTPALSRAQVENAVSGLVHNVADVAVGSVSCKSGLEGEKGETTSCEVEAEGLTAEWEARITDVDGLLMNLQVFPVLRQAAVEKSLLDRLSEQLGEQVDSVDCSADLVGDPGTTIECVAVAGEESQTFEITVTTVHGSRVNYHYEPKN